MLKEPLVLAKKILAGLQYGVAYSVTTFRCHSCTCRDNFIMAFYQTVPTSFNTVFFRQLSHLFTQFLYVFRQSSHLSGVFPYFF